MRIVAKRKLWTACGVVAGALALSAGVVAAQDRGPQSGPGGGPPTRPVGGPGGPGGFGMQERLLVDQFDKNKDGWLNKEERQPARELIKKERPAGGGRGFGRFGGGPGGPGGFGGPGPATRPADGQAGPGGPGGPGGFGGPGGPTTRPLGFGGGGGGGGRGRGGPGGMGRANPEPPKPGPRVSPDQVRNYPDSALFEPAALRTIFLEFENPDWEAELADFRSTDVDVPAQVVVDGKTYPNVGVHFRGSSSYMMVPAGSKRSFALSFDMADPKQKLYGHKRINLLNSHGDATFLRAALFAHIGRQYMPMSRVNFVKVVVNGESWGVYANVEHFDSDFTKERFVDKGAKGAKEARWKVKGSPRGGGGLTYLGDDPAAYKRIYELKTKDDPATWDAFIALCRTLNQTPVDQLEKALEPTLNIDGVLRFLVMDVVTQNEDGYWIRDSDFNIYRDKTGKFHILPHDFNETFKAAGGGPMMFGGPGGPGGAGAQGGPGGPGAQGGPGGGGGGRPRAQGATLDPLVGMDDARKPLRSKLLAVPALRERYLAYVKEIAEKSMDWAKLEPVVRQYVELIGPEVAADTRKLNTTAAFESGVFEGAKQPEAAGERGREMSLQAFVQQRREYLLKYVDARQAEQVEKAGR